MHVEGILAFHHGKANLENGFLDQPVAGKGQPMISKFSRKQLVDLFALKTQQQTGRTFLSIPAILEYVLQTFAVCTVLEFSCE